MSFLSLREHIPKEYPGRKRLYIEKKLMNLDRLSKQLNIESGNCIVDPSMFKENRKNLLKALGNRFPNAMVLLKGNGDTEFHYCTGRCFKQEPFFYWTFGVLEPGFWGAIDVDTKTSYLFYDSYVDKNQIISPSCSDPRNIATKYFIDKVMSSKEMKFEIAKLGRNLFLVLGHMDEKTFEQLGLDGVGSELAECRPWICNTVLTPIMRDCRLIKSSREDTIMRCVTRINCEGVMYVIQNVHPGSTQSCVSALFRLYVMSCLHQLEIVTPPACLGGENALCIKPPSDHIFTDEPLMNGDLCLLHMGLTLHQYQTDIVVTVPVGGHFSPTQRIIYSIVLDVRAAMLEASKPGLKFSQLETVAYQKMVDRLVHYSMLEGNEKKIVDSGLCKVFCPNGIGHFLGIDVYEGEETLADGKDYPTTSYIYGQTMQCGMIFAMNSELYINKEAIKTQLSNKCGVYLDMDSLRKYFGLVVRMLDVVAITSDSHELLSPVPRSIKDIEALMTKNDQIKFKVRDEKEQPRVPIQMPTSQIIAETIEKEHILKKNVKTESITKLRKLEGIKEKVDINKVLRKIMKAREPSKPKYVNQLIELAYQYPYKMNNMLQLVLIPFNRERRRPQLFPYPEARSLLSKTTQTFPPQGFGCPYFGWDENIHSCDEKEEFCIEPSDDHDLSSEIIV